MAKHSPPKRRVIGALKASVLLVASMLVAMGLSELLIRIVEPQQLLIRRPDIWRPADSLGYAYRANVRTTINVGEKTVTLLTDSLGYRVGQRGRIDAQRRVLLLGDSFMAAVAVEHEESLAGRLEESLKNRLGEPVAVRNTGVEGWNPSQYLIQARKSLREETYDVVVVSLFLGNDIVPERQSYITPREYSSDDAPEVKLRIPRRLDREEFRAAILLPMRNYWEARSHLFQFVKSKTLLLRTRLGLTTYGIHDVFLIGEASSRRWDTTASICREIAAVAAEHGTPTIFVLIPTVYQADLQLFDRLLRVWGIERSTVDADQPNRRLLEAMHARDLAVWDATEQIREATLSGESLYGKIDPHLNPRGHELLEDLIEPIVFRHIGASRPESHP